MDEVTNPPQPTAGVPVGVGVPSPITAWPTGRGPPEETIAAPVNQTQPIQPEYRYSNCDELKKVSSKPSKPERASRRQQQNLLDPVAAAQKASNDTRAELEHVREALRRGDADDCVRDALVNVREALVRAKQLAQQKQAAKEQAEKDAKEQAEKEQQEKAQADQGQGEKEQEETRQAEKKDEETHNEEKMDRDVENNDEEEEVVEKEDEAEQEAKTQFVETVTGATLLPHGGEIISLQADLDSAKDAEQETISKIPADEVCRGCGGNKAAKCVLDCCSACCQGPCPAKKHPRKAKASLKGQVIQLKIGKKFDATIMAIPKDGSKFVPPLPRSVVA